MGDCPWDPLVLQKEQEKMEKYRPLAIDMGRREPQWLVRTTAVVVGTLGTNGTLNKQLAQMKIWTPAEVTRLIINMQYQTIRLGAQIIRQHLAGPEQ